MRILILVLCASLALPAAVHARSHELSQWNNGQCLKLEFLPEPPPSQDKFVISMIPLAMAGLEYLVNFGASYFKKQIKKADMEYMASYQAQVAGNDLFNYSQVQNGQPLGKITLTRYAARDEGGKGQKTSFLSLKIHKEDSGAFTFLVDEAQVWRSACKIDKNEGKGNKPPKVDLRVTVTIKSFWRDAVGTPHGEILGTLVIPIPNVSVSGDTDIHYAYKTKTCEASGDSGGKTVTPIFSWFPPLPANHSNGTLSYATPFVLNISVEEFDDFKKLATKYSAVATGITDMSQATLIKLLEMITAKTQ